MACTVSRISRRRVFCGQDSLGDGARSTLGVCPLSAEAEKGVRQALAALLLSGEGHSATSLDLRMGSM
jgi:hypothetical protein